MKKTITVEVEKTISIQSFEPVKVRVTETVSLDADDDSEEVRDATYKRVTKAVTRYIENEQAKWGREAKTRKAK